MNPFALVPRVVEQLDPSRAGPNKSSYDFSQNMLDVCSYPRFRHTQELCQAVRAFVLLAITVLILVLIHHFIHVRQY